MTDFNRHTAAQLEERYAPLFEKHIPRVEVPLPTFLTLAGYPNHENVFSNIYQFFLQQEHHGLADLFLAALDDCIEHDDITMDSYFVMREYPTAKGGRIDLVIKEETLDDNPSKVVIIENKIHHELNNDLRDYWDTFSKVPDRKGILLTLQPQKVAPPFINITHKQWLDKVQQRLGSALPGMNTKYLVMLQDFMEHINGYYQKSFDMETFKFLFERGEQIHELLEIKDKGISVLTDELAKAINQESAWNWSRAIASGASFHRGENETLVMYCYYNNIFKAKEYTLEFWIKGIDNVEKWIKKGYSQAMTAIAESKGYPLFDVKPHSKEWGRIGKKSYPINSEKDLNHFAEQVLANIQNDWNELAIAIEQYIFETP